MLAARQRRKGAACGDGEPGGASHTRMWQGGLAGSPRPAAQQQARKGGRTLPPMPVPVVGMAQRDADAEAAADRRLMMEGERQGVDSGERQVKIVLLAPCRHGKEQLRELLRTLPEEEEEEEEEECIRIHRMPREQRRKGMPRRVQLSCPRQLESSRAVWAETVTRVLAGRVLQAWEHQAKQVRGPPVLCPGYAGNRTPRRRHAPLLALPPVPVPHQRTPLLALPPVPVPHQRTAQSLPPNTQNTPQSAPPECRASARG